MTPLDRAAYAMGIAAVAATETTVLILFGRYVTLLEYLVWLAFVAGAIYATLEDDHA